MDAIDRFHDRAQPTSRCLRRSPGRSSALATRRRSKAVTSGHEFGDVPPDHRLALGLAGLLLVRVPVPCSVASYASRSSDRPLRVANAPCSLGVRQGVEGESTIGAASSMNRGDGYAASAGATGASCRTTRRSSRRISRRGLAMIGAFTLAAASDTRHHAELSRSHYNGPAARRVLLGSPDEGAPFASGGRSIACDTSARVRGRIRRAGAGR